ncbi:DUF6545 domain-containing protein [Phytohabitans rumicis]|uniref:DUF6545 domain-containing protein n=1 Tax=Phytohabitans rumicis TaxID=1076125 RepID=A0A6V8LDU2_9ACTN|nr:DUF6545 domain-containing protein [Phytohabitans rumicis]GFJ93148.1 hypothetical protein Prum_067900 [Phytohabitans rumicis]
MTTVLAHLRPRIVDLGRWPGRYLLYRRLHPLWLVLCGAIPGICLNPPTNPRRDCHLPVRASYAALYRRVIEIHDGLIGMQAYADPAVGAAASRGARACGLEVWRADAVGAAVRLHVALDARAAGDEPVRDFVQTTTPQITWGHVESDVDGEARWLAHLAAALESVHRG